MSNPPRSFRSVLPSDAPEAGSETGATMAAGLPAPRLWRSRSDKVVAGVLGGLAEKLGVNSTFLRVLFATLSVFSAGLPGLLIYLVLWTITRPMNALDEGLVR